MEGSGWWVVGRVGFIARRSYRARSLVAPASVDPTLHLSGLGLDLVAYLGCNNILFIMTCYFAPPQ